MKVPSKTTRLSQVVAQSGRPEPVTLWVSPRQDSRFRTALQQNRILTVKQEPVGHRKDFGVVGFHQEPNVAYWIFPKSLKGFEDKKIVGIDYNLLQLPKVEGPLAKATPPLHPPKAAKPALEPLAKKRGASTKREGLNPAPSPAPKPPPLSKFRVTVRCISTVDLPLEVEAKNQRQAKEKALAQAQPQGADFEKGRQVRKAVRVEPLS